MEGAVGDAGVEVDPAVVVGGVEVVVHVPDLGIPAQHRVVVRRPRGRHVAQRAGVDAGQEQLGADQPVGLMDVLAEHPLLGAAGEDVGHRLVEGARLVAVDQPGSVLGDGVGQLVAEHVDRLGEPVEDPPVAVAEHQLGAVPERVDVVAAVVDRHHDLGAGVVEGVAAVDLGEEGERPGAAHGGLVDGRVAAGRLALAAHAGAGERGAVAGGVDRPAAPGGRRVVARPERPPERARRGTAGRGTATPGPPRPRLSGHGRPPRKRPRSVAGGRAGRTRTARRGGLRESCCWSITERGRSPRRGAGPGVEVHQERQSSCHFSW